MESQERIELARSEEKRERGRGRREVDDLRVMKNVVVHDPSMEKILLIPRLLGRFHLFLIIVQLLLTSFNDPSQFLSL